jgi:molecular chaperone DnaK (HSP70)
VGDAAKNQATINPENTVFDVKRLVGRVYADKSYVQADRKMGLFDVVSSREGKPRIRIQQDGKDSTYAPEDIPPWCWGK